MDLGDAEGFATIFLPDVVKYLPFHAASAVVSVSESTQVGGGNGALLPPGWIPRRRCSSWPPGWSLPWS